MGHGFYAWLRRNPPSLDLADERPRPKVADAFKVGCGMHGSPRVKNDLVNQGNEVECLRVVCLIRELGLHELSPRKFPTTTDSNHVGAIGRNVLTRDFSAGKPHKTFGSMRYRWPSSPTRTPKERPITRTEAFHMLVSNTGDDSN